MWSSSGRRDTSKAGLRWGVGVNDSYRACQCFSGKVCEEMCCDTFLKSQTYLNLKRVVLQAANLSGEGSFPQWNKARVDTLTSPSFLR